MELKNVTGFTIIELMFAILVLGALLAIAYPVYQNQLLDARRADATAALLEVVARQERFFAQNGNYSNNLGAGGLELDAAANPAFITSDRAYYEVRITAFDAATQTFTLTASAPAGSVQQNDTQCGDFTVTNFGEQDSEFGNAQDCWQ